MTKIKTQTERDGGRIDLKRGRLGKREGVRGRKGKRDSEISDNGIC